MKIAYITPGCGISGGIAVICQHITRLQKRGHEVYLLSLDRPTAMDWFPEQTVPVIYVGDWMEPLDILVATGWSTAFYLPRIAATVKCYFVQSDETRFSPEGSLWQHLATLTYYFGVHYITEAKWIQEWLRVNFGHDSELIPNGLDERIFHPAAPLEPRGPRPRVLLEGAIILPYKGMAEAFEAVFPLDVEVWCVSQLGVPKPEWRCDRFFQQVPITEMCRIYSSCDILLKVSMVEGCFGPPMEMMACGGVAIVGRVTGYDEYIIDGYNALVVDVHDVAGVRNAINKVTSDNELRSRLIANGRVTADRYKWDESINVLERHYLALLSRQGSWSESSGRCKYDASLSYVYESLSKPEPPKPEPPKPEPRYNIEIFDTDIPQPAVILCQHLLPKKWFWKIASVVKFCYRTAKCLKLVPFRTTKSSSGMDR